MTRVLVVATSRHTHGGIATVVKAHKQGEQWHKYHCKWLAVHRDGPAWIKVLYFVSGLALYIPLLPFFDIVHIHMSTKASAVRKIYFVKIAQLFRKKIVVHMHCGTQVESSWSDKMNYIFSTADIGLMLANRIKNIVASYTGREDNLSVCFNPCPPVKPQNNVIRNKYILYTGTIGKNKGYHILLQAFAKIADKHPDWTIKLAGVGELNEAQQLIEQLNLNKQVSLLGWVEGEQKEGLYRKASALCLPSFLEGFPMSVLEAWAYGVPVVSTPVGGIPDVAIDGENMLLFSPGDIDGLAIQLERIISDPDLRERLCQQSRIFAEGIFKQENINRQIGDIYASLADD